MCGICGVVTHASRGLGVERGAFDAMRDRLTHRGPDDEGTHWEPGVALGHRRLSIIDPGKAGHQPMPSPGGRFVLVYNGELYNDAELRASLEAEGVQFLSSCDTETVLHAVARWGLDACGRLRGMYALALWDRETKTLTLARDGLGIKPLYWTHTNERIIFASEIPAILLHPDVTPRPDWVTVSAYISTVRTTLDDRTLFEGVSAVRPGEWIKISFADEHAPVIASAFPPQPTSRQHHADGDALRAVIEGSIQAHLRSDVPWCSLLSGGLDSTIVASVAAAQIGDLRTYVSGCPSAGEGLADDFAFASEAADAIGTHHSEVPVDREMFLENWPAMVAALSIPMSTPNEVAINAVAQRLRADGNVVALSGEGADELFAGYELPMMSFWSWVQENDSAEDDADAAIRAASWMPTENRGLFLRDEFAQRAEADAFLLADYRRIMGEERSSAESSGNPDARLRSFLGLQRRINLVGLLQRLDTATMLASVEGRTPFADAIVLDASRALPLSACFTPGDPAQTKTALRHAFAGRIPESIAKRPKRSFPLPFQEWLGSIPPEGIRQIQQSDFLREIYTDDAIAFVCADPARNWNLAWPMFNLALWGANEFSGSRPA